MARGRKAKISNIVFAQPNEEERKQALKPPAFLEPEARKEYRRLVNLLLERQHWDPAFTTTIAIHAQELITYTTARKMVEKEGAVLYDPEKSTRSINPWVRVANQARDALVRVAPEMGLTVAGFSRINAKEGESQGQKQVVKSQWDSDLLA